MALEPRRNIQVLLAGLKACSRTRNLERGKQVHREAVKYGHDSNIYVASALVNMYSKCGSMVDAHQMFDSLRYPNVASWTALILGYAENGQGQKALDLFMRMKSGGPALNHVTLVAALKACISLQVKNRLQECKVWGKKIYDLSVEFGYDRHIYVLSALIDMYAKCGSMTDACQVFDRMQLPNVVCWNTLIMGYATNGESLSALDLFIRMKTTGPPPNYVTFLAVLKACTSLALKGPHGSAECRCWGKVLHHLAVENGCYSEIYVQSTFIDMYVKCGSIVEAQQVFDSMKHPDVVSWNALIMGYAANGKAVAALDLFTRMRYEGPTPDSVTFIAALKACSSLLLEGTCELAECKDRVKEIHDLAMLNGCNSDMFFQSALMDMYGKCGSMEDAREVFDSMKCPDVVSWNALILGYAENGQALTAMELFTGMKTAGPEPDYVTFLAALKACGLVGGLDFGRTIHTDIYRGSCLDVVVVNCLVDFYAKCGSLVEAQLVFDLHSESRNIITWNALLLGFCNCGDHEAVFKLFQRMQDAGLQPSSVTFISILTCCSHAGLVEKGRDCFKAMSTRYGIIPTVEHYNCMVDMFRRTDKLDDAMALLQHMPCSPGDITWMTVLCASRKWRNVQIGRLAFLSLISFKDQDAAVYVLMGQIFGKKGMLQEQEIVMEMSFSSGFSRNDGSIISGMKKLGMTST